MPFVTAYEKSTGRKVKVPAHFFDVPSLSRGLSKTPRQKAKEPAAKKAARKTPRKRAAKKTAAAPPAPTTTQAPATGDEKE
ncbi:hypothetical protein [Segeticoccus rhizosphaerae]|uniref:hypothetical protein n=1 Tax=Segeticoccus rhizosphaerae TaxID=1104777 RepID=UPI001939AC89|nr:hypothetical protein [Segeticoccus rhizosphaerae]